MNQHPRPEPIPLIDLAAQRRRLGKSVDEAVARVLAHCQFINGPEVTQLEAALADFSGAKHVVTCAMEDLTTLRDALASPKTAPEVRLDTLFTLATPESFRADGKEYLHYALAREAMRWLDSKRHQLWSFYGVWRRDWKRSSRSAGFRSSRARGISVPIAGRLAGGMSGA